MALLIAIFWAAFALRLEHVTEQSLWFDETSTAVSLFYGKLNPLNVEARVIVYLLMIAPFVAVVPTDFGLRWPSIIAGVLAVALIYRIGKRLHSDRAGLMAAFLLTISPQFIHYSREARYYSIVSLVALITLWLGLRLTQERREINGWFIASVMLLAGLHGLTMLWIAVLLLGLMLQRKITGQGARSDVLIGVAVGAALIVIGLYLLGMIGETRFAQGVTEGAVDAPYRLLVAFFTTGWGMIVPRDPKIVLLVMFLVLMVVGLWRTSQVDRRIFVLLGSLTVLPVIGLIALTYLYRPIFLYRYLMPSFATLILLTAILLASITRRLIAGGALAVLIMSGTLAYISEPDREREDWRGASEYLAAHLQDNDQVFVCRLRAAMPISYYLPNLMPYYLGKEQDNTTLIQEHIQQPPSAVDEAADVWIVQNYSVPCTLTEYGVDTGTLLDEPTEIVHFRRIIVLQYEPRLEDSE
jgi:mannosyltransferase